MSGAKVQAKCEMYGAKRWRGMMQSVRRLRVH